MRRPSAIADWHARAACAGHPTPSLWFPFCGRPSPRAVAICNRCPVKAECLAEALADKIGYGIWGGLSVAARARLAVCVRCGKATPSGEGNPTRIRSYCGNECRYAAQRERRQK